MANTNPVEINFYGKLIEIRIDGRDEHFPNSEMIAHQLTIINDVPILAFEFSNPKDNFFFHINIADTNAKRNYPSGDGCFKGTLIFQIENNKTRTENFELSAQNTFDLTRSLIYQQSASRELVEASIDFIYDKKIGDYEWLR
ncbi:hypothetical protein [Dyadobacter sp. CY356]|uniref:hypothetical protein n=1 Tax=Dyadobacter sp. CY356 TaxID=2906442 RepID=UPI001F289F79|nr:hypothetical protein [Dyadobacter sp. CY356]MCF0057143.1 hypothetical protein [Dyadobacter sp. CY356]